MKSYLKYFLIILLLNSCKKNEIVKNGIISGNVRNNCTGYGFSNIEVILTISHEKSFGKMEESSQSILSDVNGNFLFTGIEINKNSKYKYYISLPSKSTYDYELFGIGKTELDKNKITEFLQIGISATYKTFEIKLPSNATVNYPDSFLLNLKQKTLHKFEPDKIWELNIKNDYGTINNYPMGWWYITLNKTKNATTTIIIDSIYLDMGASGSYTIPW